MPTLGTGVAVAAQDVTHYEALSATTLQDLFIFGEGYRLGQNLVPGRPHALVIGAPVVGDVYARFTTGENYLRTAIPEALLGETFYVVARSLDTGADAAHRPQFFASGPAPSADDGVTSVFGVGMYWDGSLASAIATRGADLPGAVSGVAGLTQPVSTWALYEIRVEPSGFTWFTNLSAGEATDPSSASLPRLRSLGAYTIGSGGSGGYLGHCDIHSWWRHIGALSGEARAAARQDAREEALWAGLSV